MGALEPTAPLSLQTSFLLVREDAKAAVLLHLLRTAVRPQDQTVVFVATKHHAEYLSEVSSHQRVGKAGPSLLGTLVASTWRGLQFRVWAPGGSASAGHGRN